MKILKKTHKLIDQNKQIVRPKKNPQADISRNGSIYFAVGLLLMLIVSYYSINYKTYEKTYIDIGQLNPEELDDIEIPFIKEIRTLPPPIPIITPDIEIIDDEEELEETIMETTETDEDDKIAEVEEIVVLEAEEDVIVPFAFIEDVPIFPGCEKEKGNPAKKKCMSSKISKFVNKRFNTNVVEDLGLSGRQTIRVLFKIDKNGNVVGVRSRAPHPRLEKEAARVINLLPKMKPGKQRGKAVTVSYSLPIIFQIQY